MENKNEKNPNQEQSDITYQVMPKVNKSFTYSAPQDPIPEAPLTPQTSSIGKPMLPPRPSPSSVVRPSSVPPPPKSTFIDLPGDPDEGPKKNSGAKFFIIAWVIILVLIGVAVAYALTNNKEKDTTPKEVTSSIPKPKLKEYFGAETCLDASICGDDADPDNDGLGNYDEFKAQTDPNKPDTDGDGLADGDEEKIYKTDPTLKFTDTRDLAALNGYTDGLSIKNGYDPLTPGVQLTETRKQQISNDIANYGLHEPSIGTMAAPQSQNESSANNKTVAIFIEDGKFIPATAALKIGDNAAWLNKDTVLHKIASDPHPDHTNLPELVSSDLASGQTYSFIFQTAGTYTYHDHLNPSITGTIVVEE